MTDRIQRISGIFGLLFGAVALSLFYWGVARAPALTAREDNPRLVEAELRVQRGSILDRQGEVLAETVGVPGELERVYPLGRLHSPAVGYYSMRYGVAGVESVYDKVLRGESESGWRSWWYSLLHRYPVGRDLVLTLDADLQRAAGGALGDRAGAVVVLEARSGEILAMVSHPAYDPNQLEEGFEILSAAGDAPLLNRASQALYQPGSALAPLVLAAGLEAGGLDISAPVPWLTSPVDVGELRLSCLASPVGSSETYSAALAYGCPAPFVRVAGELGLEALVAGLESLGLYSNPSLPLPAAVGSRPDLAGGAEALRAEATGQGSMTFSPLQMAWAMAAIANDGKLPALRLVRRIEGGSGAGEIVVPSDAGQGEGISAETARTLSQLLVAEMAQGAAREVSSAAAAEGLEMAGHVGVAISGPGGARESWFLGFAPATAPEPFGRYVVVVLLEGTGDGEAAAWVAKGVLEALEGSGLH